MRDESGGTDADTLAVDGDDLAGVVDLFGGLTRAELRRALSELAFKQGADPPGDAVVEAAIEDYALVEYEKQEPSVEAETLLVPGPAAFPTLPEGAGDLPHIMDVDQRSIEPDPLGRSVERRFRGEVARAVVDGDRERIERLQDVSYDFEAWGPVDLDSLRERVDDALAGLAEE